MTHEFQNELGIALMTSVLAIVVVSALVFGVSTAVMLEHRQAQNSVQMEQAFGLAEQGLSETVANWNAASWGSLAVMDSAMITGAAPNGTGNFVGQVRRLNQELFLVDVTGRSARSGARQRLGSLVKLRNADIEIEAALTVRGPGKFGGSASIDGRDEVPIGWPGCTLGTDEAGIRAPVEDDLDFLGGCKNASCVSGDPAVEEDPTIDDDTFFNFGDFTWDDLVANADISLPAGNYQQIGPSYVGGQCNTSDVLNWGEPLIAGTTCSDYVPIIYVAGDFTTNTGVGQGVLLVEGDLSVQGGFEFYGVVIVRGKLKTMGNGNHFNGGVMAANVDLASTQVLGNAEIQYSSCAVIKAQQALSTASQLRSRGWFQLY